MDMLPTPSCQRTATAVEISRSVWQTETETTARTVSKAVPPVSNALCIVTNLCLYQRSQKTNSGYSIMQQCLDAESFRRFKAEYGEGEVAQVEARVDSWAHMSKSSCTILFSSNGLLGLFTLSLACICCRCGRQSGRLEMRWLSIVDTHHVSGGENLQR